MSIDPESIQEHPELRWAQFDDQNQAPAQLDGSHERIELPPSGQQASIETQGGPAPREDGTPNPGTYTEPQQPETAPRERRFPMWARVAAGVGALATVVGIYVSTRGGSSEPHLKAAVGHSASATAKPVVPAQSTSPNTAPSALFPDTVTQAAQEPGNLQYGSYPGLQAIDLTLNGQQVKVPELVAPGTIIGGHTYTQADTGFFVVEQVAALMSLPADSPDFTRLLNAFTDNSRVKAYLIAENERIKAKAPSPGSDQFILFDTSLHPVEFTLLDRTDPSGNAMIGVTNGTMYARYLSTDCVFHSDGTCTVNPEAPAADKADFQDIRAFNQAESNSVDTGFSFSYVPDPDSSTGAMKVNDISFGLLY